MALSEMGLGLSLAAQEEGKNYKNHLFIHKQKLQDDQWSGKVLFRGENPDIFDFDQCEPKPKDKSKYVLHIREIHSHREGPPVHSPNRQTNWGKHNPNPPSLADHKPKHISNIKF